MIGTFKVQIWSYQYRYPIEGLSILNRTKKICSPLICEFIWVEGIVSYWSNPFLLLLLVNTQFFPKRGTELHSRMYCSFWNHSITILKKLIYSWYYAGRACPPKWQNWLFWLILVVTLYIMSCTLNSTVKPRTRTARLLDINQNERAC